MVEKTNKGLSGLVESFAQGDPNFEYGDVLPIKREKETGDISPSAPNIVRGLVGELAKAIDMPGRAVRGERISPGEAALFGLAFTGSSALVPKPSGAITMGIGSFPNLKNYLVNYKLKGPTRFYDDKSKSYVEESGRVTIKAESEDQAKKLLKNTEEFQKTYKRAEDMSVPGDKIRLTKVNVRPDILANEAEAMSLPLSLDKNYLTQPPFTSTFKSPVFPKPERMSGIKGGQYIDVKTGKDISDSNVKTASISVTSAKPNFNVGDITDGSVGNLDKGSSLIRTNLFKKKAGWKWSKVPFDTSINKQMDGDSLNTLVSVEHKGKHFYTLTTNFTEGVNLKRYPDKKSEPRLRPTTTGKIKLGDQVGEILVRGKPHPVYEFINVYQEGGSIIASNPYGNYEPRGI